jgi:hypothetical protein
MSFHRYSPQKLLPDYLRGGAGLIICAGLVALAPSVTAVLVIFGGLALLFALFMLQTAQKQFLQLEMTEGEIRTASNPSRAEAWRDLRDLRLRYYALRRNKPGGWMTLRLGFPGRRISVDSGIDGFDTIVARAAREVGERPVKMDDATRANLAALGYHVGDLHAAGERPAESHS